MRTTALSSSGVEDSASSRGARRADRSDGGEVDAGNPVDRASVKDLGFEGAIGAIRGLEGTTVALRIRRAGREVDVVVTRKLVRT